jgi:hypothetical protein
MTVKFKNDSVYLSRELERESRLKAGDFLFAFKLKDQPSFGFHKASKEQSARIDCEQVKRSVNGELYFTPVNHPVRYMAAVMGLSFKKQKKLKVEKRALANAELFLWKK